MIIDKTGTETESIRDTLKFLIFISEDFFLRNYPKWEDFSSNQKKEIRSEIVNIIDGLLASDNIPYQHFPEGIEIKRITDNPQPTTHK